MRGKAKGKGQQMAIMSLLKSNGRYSLLILCLSKDGDRDMIRSSSFI